MFELSEDKISQVDNSEQIIVPTDKNFDMNASFIKKQTSQEDIDDIVNSKASQNDIDALFNSNGSSNVDESSGETASQDDIDKLFG
jgi:hypothetical protein